MEFIGKYARVDGSEDGMEHDVAGDEVNQLDLDFTDGETNFQDEEPTNYRLMNVTRDLQDAIANRSMAFDFDLVAVDPENFVLDFVVRSVMDLKNFFGFEKCIRKFDEELKIFERESKDSFYFFHTIRYLLYYLLLEKKEAFGSCQDEERLCKVLGRNFFNEFRKKIRYLINKMPRGKNNVQRELSASVAARVNGFNLVKKLTENLIRQLYRPIDIVYKPVSNINQIINCFFAVSMRNAYRVVSNKTKNS